MPPAQSPPRTALSIVIPAFNEAARIEETIETLCSELPPLEADFEIRVVDDGSADETAAIAERFARKDARVVVQREPHAGKGAAIRAGMLAAAGRLRFMCDADLSMPVHELRRFLDMVPSRCDIAIGSREGAGARRVGEPFHRHLLGRAFNGAVRGAILPGIRDSQCGFKMFTGAAADRVFARTSIQGWAFDVEALYLARRLGFRVLEMPIEWHYREHSRVSPFQDSFRMLRDVLRIKGNSLRGMYDR